MIKLKNKSNFKLKGLINISQIEIWAYLAQTAFTYIFISVATSNASKQTTLDQKQDLRTTKEDILAELKSTKEELLRESEMSTRATVEVLKAEIQRELEAVKKSSNEKE